MKTILVIDDEIAIVETLTEFLTEEGYRVVSAVTSNGGLPQLVNQSPDLVLTDSIMPIVDGPGFVQRIHDLPEFRFLPVVVMSASPEGVALSARTIGVSAVLKKPFGLDELLAVIERLIGKGEPGST
jgi:CheY-like chemotaxis protein